MSPPALALAEFAATLRHGDLPPAVREAAVRSLVDTIGVAIRGQQHPVAAMALDAAGRLSDGGRVTVWGTAIQLQGTAAVLANGVAAHVDDFDDTHCAAIVHGSAIVAPVVMALGAEHDASGADMLAAFVAGWEVAARVGLAAKGSFHSRGFHTTSIAGVFGAAAAAARLLRLTPTQTAHALGLAGSQASGINEYLSNGSSAKTFHCGWSAHAGIVAATMASAGMTGPASVFEGRDGLLRAYGQPQDADPAALDRDLGSVWEMARVSIKPYPCCHFAHAFIDCAGALAGHGIAPDDVAEIRCVVPQIEVGLICEPFAPKLRPASPYAAKFSLPYLVAARIIDGHIGHDSFSAGRIARDDVLRLAERVHYRVAEAGETVFPTSFPGWLEATLADGRTHVEKLDVNPGHPDRPLDWGEIEAKFCSNTIDALGRAGQERAFAVLREASSLPVRQIQQALHRPQKNGTEID
ncbi:MAG: MmgE/PrpD family protein [Gammaproteobacteria bacterium]|nr:MmgE/PrpD family protein [Gammaproteobacteria bacterium]